MQNSQSNHIFEEWVELYGDYLYSYTMVKINDSTLAEDIIQDTFLSAMNGFSNFKSESSVKTWLTGILKNKIWDHYRKKIDHLDINSLGMNDDVEASFFTNQSGWQKDKVPSDWILNEDEQDHIEWLKQCITSLPEKFRIIIQSKFIEEKKTETLCKDLNISTSNFFVLTYRAKLLLRNCIEHKYKLSVR